MTKENPKSELTKQEKANLSADTAPLGFEDENSGDMIIPRVKVINALSPERKDKIAEEGDIINSLTKEKLNNAVFVPVFKFNNNIWWKARSEGGGIQCIARDGKTGTDATGKLSVCASCRRCEFDNTKQGKEAIPTCTKYINFFGFFVGSRIPTILSFAKTNYAEGKKLYSLAKVTMQNMFNYGYTLQSKKVSKNGNEWYIISVAAAGPSSDEDKAYAMQLYKAYRNDLSFRYDMENAKEDNAVAGPTPDLSSVEI